MKNKKRKITPLLLGADLNAYSVALAFHEAFGVKSYVMGRYRCGLTDFSRIVKIEFCSGYESVDCFLPELFSFAKKHEGETLILVPCADCYVEFINEHEAELSRFYKFLVPNGEIRRELTDKIQFYRAIEQYGIPFPKFVAIYPESVNEGVFDKVSYPAVLKPASSAEYWRNPFPNMKKVYYPKNKEEAYKTAKEIYSYGYSGGIVLQEMIENAEIYVYTALNTKNGKSNFGILGKVVLEERGKTSEGNHSAIITVSRNALCDKLDSFLKSKKYYGFANFDILFSGGRFYVLELNARQGRSCDHIRCAGINIAERLISSFEVSEQTGNVNFGKESLYQKIIWHYPPLKTVMKYSDNEEDREEIEALKNCGSSFSALSYKPDLLLNPLRSIYVAIHAARLKKTFKNDFSDKEIKRVGKK